MMMRMARCVLIGSLLLAGTTPAHATTPMTIAMKVTAHGLVVSGISMEDRRMVIPKGTRVRLVLTHSDTNRNIHKFTLTAKDAEITSPAIDSENRKTATIEFTVGEQGQAFYRLSCELPCMAMDELVDYIIMVGPAKAAAL